MGYYEFVLQDYEGKVTRSSLSFAGETPAIVKSFDFMQDCPSIAVIVVGQAGVPLFRRVRLAGQQKSWVTWFIQKSGSKGADPAAG